MRAVRRFFWDLERFGVVPGKLSARLGRSPAAPSFSISLPKAGTHLLERALCLHPALYRPVVATVNDANLVALGGLERVLRRVRPGQVFIGHLAFEAGRARLLDRLGVRTFFLVRDPRDIVVSQAFYIVKQNDHPLHRRFAACPDLESRIRLAIDGDQRAGLVSVAKRLDDYAGWLDHDTARTVRFEALIGTDPDARDRSLVALYDHLGLTVSAAERRILASRIVSDASPTFRQGRVGGWRRHFEGTDLAAHFAERAGAQLARYGYQAGTEA